LYLEESVYLLIKRLLTIKRRKKLERVVRHRYRPKNSYKTKPGKHRLL
jgi:hypothetical protein